MRNLIEVACLGYITGQHVFKACTILTFRRNLFANTPKLGREIRKLDVTKTKNFINRHVRSFKDKYICSSKEPIKESIGYEDISKIEKSNVSANGEIINPSSSDILKVEAKEGIFERFKNTYKRHGKIFIGVHLFTSSIWTAIFYSVVASGIDISVFLKWLGVGELILNKLNSPSIGHIATTYLLYKLATPFRYTLTVAGTRYVVRYLQNIGHMPVTPEKNKLSSLIKEGGVHINKRRFNHKRYR